MKKILIIISDYYKEISENLLIGAESELKKKNYIYEKFFVHGSLEIPIVLNKFKKDYEGFVVLGCVVKGITDHYDIVKNVSFQNIYKIACENNLPLGSAILTVDDLDQAKERSLIGKRNLGGNAAKACINLIEKNL